MPSICLTGYVSIIDDAQIKLNCDNITPWSQLDASYWLPGICRHVSRDKTECSVSTIAATMYEKNGIECKRGDLNGCYASVHAKIKKYSFYTKDSKKIIGWKITATSIKQRSIPM